MALADGDSVLTAGLLVFDAAVRLHGDDQSSPLATSMAECVGRRIVTAVTIATSGRGAVAVTGRTPADVPIVAAVARLHDGRRRLALTGVAPSPIEVDPDDPTAGLSPPDDFRGSARYRMHLAAVLSERAIRELGA